MKYGFIMTGGDAHRAAELAALAEEHGWDAFFVWEGIWAVDAWVMLAAAAMRTDRIRLGTMLTPLPRRRPWDLAGQTATVDNLSGGRVILSVGLGVSGEEPRFWLFEDDPGRVTRAELLDEGLDMLTGLWRGQPFSYQGKHYRASPTDSMLPPPPVQQPRIPTWVVGAWPRPKSMARAARFDGWLPNYVPAGTVDVMAVQSEFSPQHLIDGVAWITKRRAEEGLSDEPYDVVMEGNTYRQTSAQVVKTIRPWIDAGATWWLEGNWGAAEDQILAAARERLIAGPPPL